MNSFERYEAVLNGQKPDKMPFYFPTISCSVASEILGRDVDSGGDSLHFKEERSLFYGKTAHDEFVEKYLENALELNRKLGADIIRQTWRSRQQPSKMLDDYTLLFGEENGPHMIKRYFPEYQSYGVVENTYQTRDAEDLLEQFENELKNSMGLPTVTTEDLDLAYKDQLKLQEMSAKYFPTIVGAISIGFSMDNVALLEASVMDPDLLGEYFKFQAESTVCHIKYLSEKGFKVLGGGTDIATNNGPMISPACFDKIFSPMLKIYADECTKYGIKYCYKTDGNTWQITDIMFKKCGVQAYGEVDRIASMDVGRLREKYPELLILGNVGSATLVNGTEAQVRAETKASLEESRGTRYIPGPSNAIVHGTPVRNVYAMIEEIDRYKP